MIQFKEIYQSQFVYRLKSEQSNNRNLIIITPVGIGKPQKLKDKYLILYQKTIFQQKQSKKNMLHPLFKLMIQNFILFTSILPISESNIISMAEKQFANHENNFNKIYTKEIMFLIDEVYTELKSMINQIKATESRRYRLNIYKNLIESLKKQALKHTQLLEPKRSKNQISYLIKCILSIEPLTQKVQKAKISYFITTHKKFFQFNNKKDQSLQITINSQKKQLYGQTLEQFIQKYHLNGNNNISQLETIIKKIFKQLKRYTKAASPENSLSYFYHLSANSIYNNPISLQINLSFQQLLKQALGFKKEPYSIQGRITFKPTPQDYNYLLTPFELENINILNDPLQGQLNQFSSRQDLIEREMKVKVKEKVTVWRFILLSYYILNNKYYANNQKLVKHAQIYQQFKKKITLAANSLQDNMSQISNFISCKNQKYENSIFQFKMDELDKYLQINQTNDSLVQALKHLKCKKYFILRNRITREFIRLLISEQYFNAVLNSKKYSIILFLIAYEMLMQAQMLYDFELIKKGQCKQIRQVLQKNIKRSKTNQSHYQYFQITFNKLNEYVQRNRSQLQSNFLNQNQYGKRIWKLSFEVNQSIQKFYNLDEKLKQIENQNQNNFYDLPQYKQGMKDLQKKNIQDRKLIKQIIIELFYLQFQDGKIQSFNILKQEQKQKQQKKMQYTIKKLEGLFYSFISLTYNNFSKYDTLVIPRLNLNEETNQKLKKAKYDEKDVSYYQDCIENIQMALSLINYKALQPQKFKHFVK